MLHVDHFIDARFSGFRVLPSSKRQCSCFFNLGKSGAIPPNIRRTTLRSTEATRESPMSRSFFRCCIEAVSEFESRAAGIRRHALQMPSLSGRRCKGATAATISDMAHSMAECFLRHLTSYIPCGRKHWISCLRRALTLRREIAKKVRNAQGIWPNHHAIGSRRLMLNHCKSKLDTSRESHSSLNMWLTVTRC